MTRSTTFDRAGFIRAIVFRACPLCRAAALLAGDPLSISREAPGNCASCGRPRRWTCNLLGRAAGLNFTANPNLLAGR